MALMGYATSCPRSSRAMIQKKNRPFCVGHTAGHGSTFAHTFAHWCVVQKYLAFNPFKDVEKARNTTRRRVFRALTKEEQHRLLTRTLSAERRMIYLIALLSGLRLDEIARLCWAHMDLDRP